MTTYLLTWNPARWDWRNLQQDIQTVERQGYFSDSWSSGVTKRIVFGDRVFLMKLGAKPRGIFASGWATSKKVYEGRHWDKEAQAQGKTAYYIGVDFDTILDPAKSIFSRERLDDGIYSKMRWEPQASGVTIPEDVATKLEYDWACFLERRVPPSTANLTEEVNVATTFYEGAVEHVTVNSYERSVEARSICIQRQGLDCSICGFNFEKTYGGIGAGFIHVHHLKPLAEIKKGYKLDPLKELRPVCPNCHAMLHQRKPAYSIEELRAIIRQSK